MSKDAPTPLDPADLPEGMDRILKEYGATLSQLNTLNVACQRLINNVRPIKNNTIRVHVQREDLLVLAALVDETSALIKRHLEPEKINDAPSLF